MQRIKTFFKKAFFIWFFGAVFVFLISGSALHAQNYALPASTQKMLDSKFFENYNKVGKYYENAIASFNPRLPSEQLKLIAQSIIYYTMYFNDYYNGGSSYKLDPRLVIALIAVESRFKPLAVSSKGAMGLGQLMPFKAKELGIGSVAFHPQYNIFGTIRTLRGLYDLYTSKGYSWYEVYQFSLAAYNAGSGAVAKYHGIPPYTETRNYVWKVNEYYRRLAPERFPQ